MWGFVVLLVFFNIFYYLPVCGVLTCFKTFQIIIRLIPSWIRTNGTYQGTVIKDLSRVIQATK